MTEICSTISSGSNVVTPDIVVADVRRLIDTEGLTFRAVGRLEPYSYPSRKMSRHQAP
ncbi:MAG: hypothetical protein ACXABD_22150 [Candidatus Thorarchaeota archaeon]|jgi:hypothetical protein